MTNWQLSFAFRDPSPSFARGFTCGKLWFLMKTETTEFDEIVMEEIKEDIIAMATAQGWTEKISPLGDGWLQVRLTPPAPSTERDERT